jgi:hypothetical protein
MIGLHKIATTIYLNERSMCFDVLLIYHGASVANLPTNIMVGGSGWSHLLERSGVFI